MSRVGLVPLAPMTTAVTRVTPVTERERPPDTPPRAAKPRGRLPGAPLTCGDATTATAGRVRRPWDAPPAFLATARHADVSRRPVQAPLGPPPTAPRPVRPMPRSRRLRLVPMQRSYAWGEDRWMTLSCT